MARWKIDTSHTNVEFAVRHLMVSKTKGTFSDISGWLEFNEENPSQATIEAYIDVNSVNTAEPDRDAHLRSADFFDAGNYPIMSFKSHVVDITGDNTGYVTGDLTIRGVTHEVTFDIEYFGQLATPFGDERAGFSGQTKINREDFGLMWNQALETGGFLVGKEVEINIELEVIKEALVEIV